ncbi:Ig-like domain-containing protein [Frondihabitans cladoniiphilus]|uniref:Bacterial Ig domain-containing protein n=1 Tax=Frondihabitans cladoniiphilus TaxID=715785 RepID=A0ABP8W1T2_9MICO
MFPRKTLATVCLGACLTAGALGSGVAATAAPAPTPARASTPPTPTTDVTTTPTIDGTRAVITITGQKGQKIVIRDAGQRAIAGTTLTTPTTTLTFTAPTTKQAYTVDVDGTPHASAAFTLRDDIVTPTDKPTVDDVDTTGTRAVVDVTAAPRAVVKVKNDDGEVLGLRLADARGHATVSVPVAADDDTALSVSQTVGAIESEDEDFWSLVDFRGADVTYTGLTHALLSVKAFADGQLVITAEDGAVVWNKPMFHSQDGARAMVPVTPGKATKYTLTRSNSWGTGKPLTIEVPAAGSHLEKPDVSYVTNFSPDFLNVKGIPGATVHATVDGGFDNGGWEHSGLIKAGGGFPILNPPAGHYVVTQEFGDDVSESVEIDVPPAN